MRSLVLACLLCLAGCGGQNAAQSPRGGESEPRFHGDSPFRAHLPLPARLPTGIELDGDPSPITCDDPDLVEDAPALPKASEGEPGTLDGSFGVGGSYQDVSFRRLGAVEEQSDGKLVFTGESSTYSELRVCRVLADGTRDSSFGADGCASFDFGETTRAYVLALDVDETIVVAGVTGRHMFAGRLSSSGAPDPAFGRSGFARFEIGSALSIPSAIAIDSAGILLGGNLDDRAMLLRLSPTGHRMLSFGSGGVVVLDDLPVLDMERATDCKIHVTTGTHLYRLEVDGRLDPSFGDGVSAPTTWGWFGLARAGDRLFVTGGGMQVARISPSGEIEDETAPLDPGETDAGETLYAVGRDLAVLPGGGFIIGGRVATADPQLGMGRLLADGTPDEAFGPGGARPFHGEQLEDLELSRDGSYVIAGHTGDASAGLLMRVSP